MPTLTAVEIGTETLPLFSGGAIGLPSQSAFYPPQGTTLGFPNGDGERYAAFVMTANYQDPDMVVWQYSVLTASYVTLAASVNFGSDPNVSGGFAVYDGEKIMAGFTDDTNGIVYVAESDPFALDAGPLPVGALTVSSLNIASPYANYGTVYWNIQSYALGLTGYYFTLGDNDTTDARSYLAVPDGMGGLTQLQVFNWDATTADYTGTFGSCFSGGRARTILTNTITGTLQLIDWAPTAYGAAFDNNIFDLDFDDPTLLTYYDSIIQAGDFFYFVYLTDDMANNVIPFILRVNLDFTEYTRIQIDGGDAAVQARLDDWVLGIGYPSFNIDPSNPGALLMTTGDEPPMFYASSIASIAGASRTTKMPFPLGLPCIVPCIPVIDRRLRK